MIGPVGVDAAPDEVVVELLEPTDADTDTETDAEVEVPEAEIPVFDVVELTPVDEETAGAPGIESGPGTYRVRS